MRYAIILDTNVLVDYIQESHMDKFGDFYILMALAKSSNIQIYIVDIVKNEWVNLKYEKFDKEKDSINNRFKSFINFLDDKDVKSLSDYSQKGLELIKRFKNKYEAIAKLRLYEIDNFIIPYATIISHESILVSKALARYILEFKEPFFNKGLDKQKLKIESEDAAIFLSSYFHFKTTRHDFEEIFFVTGNKRDFSHPNNPVKIHPNLKDNFDEVNITYVFQLTCLYSILSSSFPLIQSLSQDIQKSNEITFEYLSDNAFINCPACDDKIHRGSAPRQSINNKIYYACIMCNNSIDSGLLTTDDIY